MVALMPLVMLLQLLLHRIQYLNENNAAGSLVDETQKFSIHAWAL